MLVSLKQILQKACAENYAVAAPNVNTSLEINAVIAAAEEMNAPLILDVHPEMVEIPCPREFGCWMRTRCEKAKVPIAINEDDGGSFAGAVERVQSGTTAITVNRSALPFEMNIAEVKKVVEMAHSVGVSCEAELGHGAELTTPEKAARFIEETKVDCLAVAVGTAYGAYPEGEAPRVEFDRLSAIKKAAGGFPLVLHGCTGTPQEQLFKACRMGINKVNLSKDLWVASRREVLNSEGLSYTVELVARGIRNKLKEVIPLYGSDGKAW